MSDAWPPIRTLSSRDALATPWMTIREDEIEYADGTRGTYSLVVKPDFALVLPYEDGGFWVVREFRYAIGARVWNFPQGGWPAGRGGTQEELAAAELREETGLRADTFTPLGRLRAAVGYAAQAYDVFLATGLTPGPPEREIGEADMTCEWLSVERIRGLIRAGEFPDAHSVAGLALWDLHTGS